jgi:hypothetical protein
VNERYGEKRMRYILWLREREREREKKRDLYRDTWMEEWK